MRIISILFTHKSQSRPGYATYCNEINIYFILHGLLHINIDSFNGSTYQTVHDEWEALSHLNAGTEPPLMTNIGIYAKADLSHFGSKHITKFDNFSLIEASLSVEIQCVATSTFRFGFQ